MVGMKTVAGIGGTCLILGAGGGFAGGWRAHEANRWGTCVERAITHDSHRALHTNDSFTPPINQNSTQLLPKNLTTTITTPTAPISERTALPVEKTAGSRRPIAGNRNTTRTDSPFKATSTQPSNTAKAIRRTGAKTAKRFKA